MRKGTKGILAGICIIAGIAIIAVPFLLSFSQSERDGQADWQFEQTLEYGEDEAEEPQEEGKS